MFVTLFFPAFLCFGQRKKGEKNIIKVPQKKKKKFGRVSGLLLESNMPGKGENPHVAPLRAFDLHTGPAGQAQGEEPPGLWVCFLGYLGKLCCAWKC